MNAIYLEPLLFTYKTKKIVFLTMITSQ